MKMEKRWLWSELGYELGLIRVLIHHIIKARSSKNRQKTKRHKEKPERPRTRGRTAVRAGRTAVRPPTTGRASHHGQPVVATVPPGLFVSRTTHFGFLWTLIWASYLAYIESFGPHLQPSLILMALTSLAWIHLKHFSPKLGLNHRNLQ